MVRARGWWATEAIEAFLNDPIDRKGKTFETYEQAKKRIKLVILALRIEKKTRKKIDNLEGALAEGKEKSILILTEGKGEDAREEEVKGK